VIDCSSLNAYCYICDDFIQNHLIPRWVFESISSAVEDSNVEDEDGEEGSGLEEDENDENYSVDAEDEDDEETSRSSSLSSNSSIVAGPTSNGRSNGARKGRKTKSDEPFTSVQVRTTRKRSSGLDSPPTRTLLNVVPSPCRPPSHDLSNSNGSTILDPKKRRLDPDRLLTANGNTAFGGAGIRKAKVNVTLGSNGKHGVVGLRNLGNTCFMNAVLQSLSKIRGFSCYIAHIPPPDELRLNLNNNINTPNLSQTSPKRFVYSTRSRKNNNNFLSSSNNLVSNGSAGEGANDLFELKKNEELLTCELKKIVILLNTKGSSAVSPDSLFSIIWDVMPRFRGYQQQDAHEFLRYMLDQLHNELIHLVPKFSWSEMNGHTTKPLDNHPFKYVEKGKNGNGLKTDSFKSTFGYNSIVTSMFGGLLENEVRCSRCGTESRKNDPFLDLSLDIPLGSNGDTRLEDCLSSFTEVEELSDSDKYFCANCKTHQKSTKRFSIQRLPNVLCLHLKRFRWSNSCFLRTKLDHFVQFPITSLDMSDYLLDKLHTTRGSVNSNLYDLTAVIVHHGSGVGSGHYTAFAKKDGQWYHFNDSTVKPSEETAVSKCKAYILFYTRNEFKL